MEPSDSGQGTGPIDLSPTLDWALSRILPGREETLLLRAILHRGPHAHQDWSEFTRRIPDLPALFRMDRGGRKRLGPLLLASIRENDLDADAVLLTVLRTAFLREELRAQVYRNIERDVFEALRTRGIRFLVLKGAALMETAYPEPTLRHAHDVDLLLPKEELREAEEALADLGLKRAPSLVRDRGIAYRHQTDTPIQLLTRLFQPSVYQGEFDEVWPIRREVASDLLGPIQIPTPAANLLHALGHASYWPGRSTLSWVTDAWMILLENEPVDWDGFGAMAKEWGLALPVYVMLRYLEEELEAAIPRETLRSLGEGARGSGTLQRDVALYGARQTRKKSPELTDLRRPGWTERLTLMWWQVFPSREYIRWAYGNPRSTLLPFIYLTRPVTYLTERLKWRVLGWVRRLSEATAGT